MHLIMVPQGFARMHSQARGSYSRLFAVCDRRGAKSIGAQAYATDVHLLSRIVCRNVLFGIIKP